MCLQCNIENLSYPQSLTNWESLNYGYFIVVKIIIKIHSIGTAYKWKRAYQWYLVVKILSGAQNKNEICTLEGWIGVCIMLGTEYTDA